MTLFQIIQILKEITLTQPNVKTATDGSIYDVMNTNPSVKYDVVHFSQTTHQSDEETDFYGLNVFYVSRLEDSLEDNRLQIQSIGKEVLDNIIRTFCENWGIDFPIITYTPFTQKFNDLCAGCYCNLRLEVPKDLLCADDYVAEVVPGSGIKLQDIAITIDRNGITVLTPAAEYDGIGEVRIVTDVPQAAGNFQDKEVEYTENGSYVVRPDPSYDAMTSVSVDVLVPDNYDKGYEDGKEDGAEEQKAKMTSLSVTANGNYNRADGYSAVTVDVPQTGQTINNQTKNILLKTSDFHLTRKGDGPYFYAFSPNALYHITYDSGYTGLEEAILNCGLDPYEAIALGENQQKAKMVATAITENGEYGRPDGYSAVTVNVPDRYDDGFADGEQAQKDKMVTTSVTENGLYYREDGYSAFLVDVPQTGASNEDLKANLEGRYYLIPEGTSQLRAGAFYRACFETITIPSSVQTIGTFAFAQNQCLTSMTIPDTVLSIGTYIFSGDTNLESVYLGTGLTQIPMYAFATCPSLTGVTFPATITDIGTFAFNTGNTGLEEIRFEGLVPPTLASTGNSLGPTGFTFPIYVPCQSLDAYKTAFGTRYATRIQCWPEEMITALTLNVATAITDSGTATTTYSPASGTTDIRYSCNNTAYATIGAQTGVITVVANGNVTICATDRISGLQDCKNVQVTKTVPEPTVIPYYTDTSVIDPTGETRTIVLDLTGLDPNSVGFAYTGATGLTYSISGDTITVNFPANTGLSRSFKVHITANTLNQAVATADINYIQGTEITSKWLAITFFSNCSGGGQYKTMHISNGRGSFDKVSDGKRIVNGNLTHWTGTTYYTGSTTLYFHLTGTSINDYEFYRSDDPTETDPVMSISNIKFPDGLTSIGAYAFGRQYHTSGSTSNPRYCGLSALTIPTTVTTIGESAFEYCKALASTNLIYLTGLTAIPSGAFIGSAMENVVVPYGVRTLGEGAFHSQNTRTVRLPVTLTAVGDYALCINGSGDKSFTFLGSTPPTFGCCNFGSCVTSGTYTIYVPANAVNAYKAALPASESSHIQPIQ